MFEKGASESSIRQFHEQSTIYRGWTQIEGAAFSKRSSRQETAIWSQIDALFLANISNGESES
jgi:hypothetical protein